MDLTFVCVVPTELPADSQAIDRFQFDRPRFHAELCQTCVILPYSALDINCYPVFARRIDFSKSDPIIDRHRA